MPPVGNQSVFVVGTRAQLIKVAPVIVSCETAGQHVVLLLTGQHKETMQDLIEEFGIRTSPELVVHVSERATVLALLTWAPRALLALAWKLRKLRSDRGPVNVAVHGDTLSTAIGAMAAKLTRGRVFHVESGLSSGKLLDPFPEEITRRLVFRLTDVALCPGAAASSYMQTRHRCRVVDTVENTIVDSVRIATEGHVDVRANFEPYLVVSLHRFQNIFNRTRLLLLVDLIESLAASFKIHFVLHPATRTRLAAEGMLERLAALPSIKLSPRLGYRDFLKLAYGAECVLTDGGSNQEELAVLGVPTIVMRERTERGDGLGSNVILEADATGGVLAYVRDRRFHDLRRANRSDACSRPSEIVAAEMERPRHEV